MSGRVTARVSVRFLVSERAIKFGTWFQFLNRFKHPFFGYLINQRTVIDNSGDSTARYAALSPYILKC